MMKDKYPDPGTQAYLDAIAAANPEANKKGKDKKDKKGKKEEVVEVVVPKVKEPEKENSICDIDSVIDDGEIPEFTADMIYMRGSSLSPEVKSKMENFKPSR
jgi:hypothetical protein